MAKRGVKKRDYEKLDDSTVGRVISLLEQDAPITKKEACSMLNIAYNTKRLADIIKEYKDKQDYKKKRREQNKGKPLSQFEIRDIIIAYLSGTSIAKISEDNYRSIGLVKSTLEKYKIPARSRAGSYQEPELIPDEALRQDYTPGEFVWSARYNCVAEIKKYLGEDKEHGKVYRLWVFGIYNQFATQPWYELGSLDILKEFNLSKDQFQNTEQPNIVYRID